MDTDEKHADVEQILIKLRAYVNHLNKTLRDNIPEEMKKSKKECKELVDLAGELDALFTK